ncbi:glycosyltransferase family 2 protein [Catenovulum sediminis]|uniref:glycosyltransferase family 2 protein n=1 Tax=Catenovulum sediminis TaxID=1740262 RepID=UPI0011801F2A|nr:glycosyltransferase family A protein [Catenovulum sediminis]
MTTVDIILCVYNAEDTLAEAIDSVLAQSYQDFKLWIVNDGSPDNSQLIIDKYATLDSRISTLKHDNCGLGLSRNKAINAAIKQGAKYIAFIDADDVWLSDKLTLQMQAFASHPEADIVVTDMIYYAESENYTPPIKPSIKFEHIQNIFSILCTRNFPFQPVTAVLKANLFSDIAEFTSDKSGQDFYPFLKFAYADKNYFKVPLPLYRERQLEGSLQRSPKSGLLSGTARKNASKRVLAEGIADNTITHEKAQLLKLAHDRFCSWMLSGARKALPYRDSVKLALAQKTDFHSQTIFWRELGKSLLYPIAPK